MGVGAGLSEIAGLIWGIAGGVAAEIAHLYAVRDKPTPLWLRSFRYWVITIAMIGVGGGLVYAYVQSGVRLSDLAAAQLGAAAPLLVRTFTAGTPHIQPGPSN
jgi:hypothetical protein